MRAADALCGVILHLFVDKSAFFAYDRRNTENCVNKCRHQWLIEFAQMPDSPEKFAQILDDTLKEVNSDYEAKRQNDLALQPLEIIVARKGLFHDWLDSKGKLGGQHKVPRLSNTREHIEEMLKLNFKE